MKLREVHDLRNAVAPILVSTSSLHKVMKTSTTFSAYLEISEFCPLPGNSQGRMLTHLIAVSRTAYRTSVSITGEDVKSYRRQVGKSELCEEHCDFSCK